MSSSNNRNKTSNRRVYIGKKEFITSNPRLIILRILRKLLSLEFEVKRLGENSNVTNVDDRTAAVSLANGGGVTKSQNLEWRLMSSLMSSASPRERERHNFYSFLPRNLRRDRLAKYSESKENVETKILGNMYKEGSPETFLRRREGKIRRYFCNNKRALGRH